MKFRALLYSLLFMTAFHSTTAVMAQPAKTSKVHLNHIAIYVVDLAKSTAFYKDIIGLDTIPEPFHDGHHTWFSIGQGHLHVISGAAAATEHNKNSHLCFSVKSMDDFLQNLDKNKIEYENWAGEKHAVTKRVDGIRQIWFKDLDGYWIEINNDY